MRTTNFSQILFDALQYSGNDRNNITDETFQQFRDFANARLREIWEGQQWNNICRVNSFTTTVDGNNVTYFVPSSDAGEILGVYTLNPLISSRAVQLNYQVYDNGTETRIILDSSSLSTGYYYYRLKTPVLFGDIYNQSTIYYAGSQIYFDSGSGTGTYVPIAGKPHSGNFYTCIINTNAGESPLTHPAKWKIEQIPYEFGTFIAYGCCANWLISENMIQEAIVLEQKTQSIIDIEIDKLVRQQNQMPKLKFTNPYR